jgi:hypothetical protein
MLRNSFFARLSAKILVAILLTCSSAFAATTDYTISGVGSGSLNGTAFTDQNFLFSLVGDSSSGNPIDPLFSATVSIAGFGTTTLSIPTRLGLANSSAVYFSRSGMGGLDLFDFYVQNGSLVNGLVGPFSVTGTSIFALNQFQNVGSSLGALTFNSSSNVTFTAAVPEPETYAMMMAGLGMLGFIARRRKQSAA